MIEEEIAEAAAAAKLRLRFDKVVVRLVGRLKTALADRVPDGEALIFTCTARSGCRGKRRRRWKNWRAVWATANCAKRFTAIRSESAGS
jgi:hypothetical protein